MIAMGHFESEGNFTAGSQEIHAALTAAKVFRARSKDFANLALDEQRIDRARKEACKALGELQAERKAAAKAQDEPASTIELTGPAPATKAAAAAANQTPAMISRETGFVYSNLESVGHPSCDSDSRTLEIVPRNRTETPETPAQRAA